MKFFMYGIGEQKYIAPSIKLICLTSELSITFYFLTMPMIPRLVNLLLIVGIIIIIIIVIVVACGRRCCCGWCGCWCWLKRLFTGVVYSLTFVCHFLNESCLAPLHKQRWLTSHIVFYLLLKRRRRRGEIAIENR